MSPWLPDRVELRLGDGPARGSARQPGPQRIDVLIADFEQNLEARALRRGTRLRCIVAGDAVRYAVVPWHAELSSPDQRQRLTEQCFRETYGEVARDWTVCQYTERYAAATLACAIDTSLLDRLDALAQARGLSLVSVQPSLMHAFNQSRHAIAQGLFWFVSVEPHWTTLLLMSAFEPLHVKRLPSAAAALGALLEREWFPLGIDAARCPAYVVRSAMVEPPPAPSAAARDGAAASWQIIDLSPASDPEQRAEALKAA